MGWFLLKSLIWRTLTHEKFALAFAPIRNQYTEEQKLWRQQKK
jgi:hypothetical protein